MKDAKILRISIIGRRWFQRTSGNTYNTAEVTVIFSDGTISDFKLPREYGYGDYYLQRATDELERLGFMPGRKHYANGSAEPEWQYFRDRNIPVDYHALDVPRQKDL